jgi:hypothetical protein
MGVMHEGQFRSPIIGSLSMILSGLEHHGCPLAMFAVPHGLCHYRKKNSGVCIGPTVLGSHEINSLNGQESIKSGFGINIYLVNDSE